MASKSPIRREDLAPGACLCDHCTGKCCRYFCLPIATPVKPRDYARIRGYLEHERTLVYVDEKETWYLVVMARCKYLTAQNRCEVYLNRPRICQEYTTAECEYDTDWTFEKVFETPEQLAEYAEAIQPPARRTGDAPRAAAAQTVDEAETFTLPIEAPATWDDYDAIRWYLAHGGTRVTVRSTVWFLTVDAPRRTRGDRSVSGRVRPFASEGSFEKVFESPEQLWEYAEAVLPPRRRRRGAGPALPIVTLGENGG